MCKPFIYRLNLLDELVDFTIIETRIETRSYLPKSPLNSSKNTKIFIGERRIEVGTGSDNAFKVSETSNLVTVFGVGSPGKDIGVIE